jgi:TonB family protein
MRRDEEIRGWVGTILFHVLLAFMLFLWQVNVSTGEPEYVEVSFRTANPPPVTLPERQVPSGGDAETALPPLSARRLMSLTERRIPSADDEALHIPSGHKMTVDDAPAPIRSRVMEHLRDEKELFSSPGKGSPVGAAAYPRVSGVAGVESGRGVSVMVTWSGGGARKRISGELPAYPGGVKITAQIMLEAVVMPDGTVRSLKAVRKGSSKVEESAIKAVRLWRFEPLRRSLPQRDQVCTVAVTFTSR